MAEKISQPNENQVPVPNVDRIVEDVLGCKWSSAVLRRIGDGVLRPGALRRAIPGISTKVLNERLQKMVRYGLLKRREFPEIPPRVEYRLTPLGRDFVGVLRRLDRIREKHGSSPTRSPDRSRTG